MLASFLGVLPILTPPLCALTFIMLSCALKFKEDPDKEETIFPRTDIKPGSCKVGQGCSLSLKRQRNVGAPHSQKFCFHCLGVRPGH
jgi:hypothetical protein